MKRLPIILLAISVSALAVMFTSFTPPSASAAGCGPGSHWIDTCPVGTDDLGITSVDFGIDTDGDCLVELNLNLTGPVTVDRAAASDVSANFGGVGSVDSHLDVIDTEIMTMTMTGGGFTMKVGTSTTGINAGVPRSLGALEEQAGNNLLGDSFFDIFFEADDGVNPKTYNQSALRLDADPPLDRVPPLSGTDYGSLTSECVDLWTAPSGGFDTGVNLVATGHHSVGGIAEVIAGGSVSPASASAGSGSSALTYAGLAGAVAAGMLAVAAGGWYGRRRWLR